MALIDSHKLFITNERPQGITYNSDSDELLVVDGKAGTWFRYETDGTYIGRYELNSANSHPQGIAYDSDNDEVLVVDSTDKKWYRYETDGTYIGSRNLNSANSGPNGITYDSDNDEVLVLDANTRSWFRYETDGTYIGSRDLGIQPGRTGITYDSDSKKILVVSRNPDIWVQHNTDGTVSGFFSLPTISNDKPRGITYDSDNDEVLVVDEDEGSWFRYETDGTYIGTRNLNSGNSAPQGITYDSDNDEVLVVDSVSDRWYRYETDGTYIGTRNLNSANSDPTGITYDSDNDEVLVVDHIDKKWYRYETDGTYLGSRNLNSGNRHPQGITYDSDNDEVLVVDFSDEQWYRSKTNGDQIIGTRSLNSANSDPTGITYVSDNNTFLVVDISTQKWYVYFFGIQFTLTQDPDNTYQTGAFTAVATSTQDQEGLAEANYKITGQARDSFYPRQLTNPTKRISRYLLNPPRELDAQKVSIRLTGKVLVGSTQTPITSNILQVIQNTMTIQAVLQVIEKTIKSNFTVSVDFPESVTGVDLTDFNIDAPTGVTWTLTGSGKSYALNFTVLSTAKGVVSISVGGIVTTGTGSNAKVRTVISRGETYYIRETPFVEVEEWGNPTETVSTKTFNFPVTFTQAIKSFGGSALSIRTKGGASANGLSAGTPTGSNESWSIPVTYTSAYDGSEFQVVIQPNTLVAKANDDYSGPLLHEYSPSQSKPDLAIGGDEFGAVLGLPVGIQTADFNLPVQFNRMITASTWTDADVTITPNTVTVKTTGQLANNYIPIDLPTNAKGTAIVSITGQIQYTDGNTQKTGVPVNTPVQFQFNTTGTPIDTEKAFVSIGGAESPVGTLASQPISEAVTIDFVWTEDFSDFSAAKHIHVYETTSAGAYNPLDVNLANVGTTGTFTNFRLTYTPPVNKKGSVAFQIQAGVYKNNPEVFSQSIAFDTTGAIIEVTWNDPPIGDQLSDYDIVANLSLATSSTVAEILDASDLDGGGTLEAADIVKSGNGKKITYTVRVAAGQEKRTQYIELDTDELEILTT